MAEAEQPSSTPGPEIQIHPEMLGGVWSNCARVGHSPFEFTIDFIRMDYSFNPPKGIVVSRINLSPLFVTQLMDAMQENWGKYAEKALPKEMRDDDSSDHGTEAR